MLPHPRKLSLEAYSVKECPSGAFRALMLTAAQTSDNPEEVAKQLAGSGYDFCHTADKWAACELLSEHHARLPLFASEEEARKSIVTTTK